MAKRFQWSERKNAWLRENRGVSFEDIIEAIAHRLLDVRMNKSSQHRGQKIFIVEIESYPWVIPFRETKEAIFLITVFPDRKLKEEFGYED